MQVVGMAIWRLLHAIDSLHHEVRAGNCDSFASFHISKASKDSRDAIEELTVSRRVASPAQFSRPVEYPVVFLWDRFD